MDFSVTVQDLMNEFDLTPLTKNADLHDRKIYHPDVNRLTLQLTGYFEFFEADRLQIIGLIEHSYLRNTSGNGMEDILDNLFSRHLPCVVFTRGLLPNDDIMRFAAKYDVPIFSSQLQTSDFMSEAIRWLRVRLAPRITIHGVLVDVYGEGVLIIGESGIGKSEAALELIKRGHRFVADDAVEIKKVSKLTLVGSCPEIIKYFIELRGIGIIDVRQMFGVQSIKATQSIDLIIRLELWDKDDYQKSYRRISTEEEYMEFLGNKVICHTIPIRPGRNLAVICEAAAINHRQKKMGYNAEQFLSDRIAESIAK